ncbi:MAG TPA: phosphomannose isomerase type II C-terminal cupin domain [Candidatus Doudnabacteria bacterium]|nr:phosphomannose isomerase type II C-terminal cupin domain [Candidatus Doudnabacteria bacterium]
MAKNAKQFEERPWGNFSVLSELSNEGHNRDIIIKRLEVLPGKRISYQQHKLRHEHWFAISGSGFAIINDEKIQLKAGESVQIGIGDKHRIDNRQGTEPLVIIEITTGEFDEYDNERLEDDFDRDSNWRNE